MDTDAAQQMPNRLAISLQFLVSPNNKSILVSPRWLATVVAVEVVGLLVGEAAAVVEGEVALPRLTPPPLDAAGGNRGIRTRRSGSCVLVDFLFQGSLFPFLSEHGSPIPPRAFPFHVCMDGVSPSDQAPPVHLACWHPRVELIAELLKLGSQMVLQLTGGELMFRINFLVLRYRC